MERPTDSTGSEPDHVCEIGPEERPSEVVIAAVAESASRSPFEMAPLAETIDPDALDSAFDNGTGRPSSVTVAFEYCARRVTVTPSEVRIDLRP